VQVEKYLHGTVFDIGGNTKANVHIKLENEKHYLRLHPLMIIWKNTVKIAFIAPLCFMLRLKKIYLQKNCEI